MPAVSKKRSHSQSSSPVTVPLPPCKVCGEAGTGFHYGVNTCEACKAFFHRSLSRKNTYQCICSTQSGYTSEKKKGVTPCAKCRYTKCLSVGMSLKACKTGRYSFSKRKSDELELRSLVEEGKVVAEKLKAKSASKKNAARDSPSRFSSNDTVHVPSGMSIAEEKEEEEKAVLMEPSSICPEIPENVSSHSTTQGYQFAPQNPGVAVSSDSGHPMMTSHSSMLMVARNEPRYSEGRPNQKWVDPHGSPFSNSDNTVEFKLPESPISDCGAKPTFFGVQLREVDKFDVPETTGDLPSPRVLVDLEAPKPPSPQGPSPLGTPKANRAICKHVGGGNRLGISSYQNYEGRLSEEEFKDIQFITATHRKYVVKSDYNECSEAYLQGKLDHAIRVCHMRHNTCPDYLMDFDEQMDNPVACLETRTQKAIAYVEMQEIGIKELAEFFKRLPEFKSLSLTTQVNMLKESFQALSSIGTCRTYHAKYAMAIDDKFTACIHEMAEWGKSGLELGMGLCQLAQEISSLRLTYEMKVLLKMAIFFNPDCARENDRETVERLKHKYTRLLMKMYMENRPHQSRQESGDQIEDLLSTLMGASKFMRDSMEDIKFTSHLGTMVYGRVYLEVLAGFSHD